MAELNTKSTALGGGARLVARIRDGLLEMGLGVDLAHAGAGLVVAAGIVSASVVLHLLFSKAILRYLTWLVKRSHFSWDNVFLETKALKWLTHWAPALMVYLLARYFLAPEFPPMGGAIQSVAKVYAIVTGGLAAYAILEGFKHLGQKKSLYEDLPFTTLIQLAKLLLILTATLLIIATLTGQDVVRILAGMGVMTSVLMLIFKDSILGLVAGIQLSANGMIRRGDWIEMPKYCANGDVEAVGLTTVKVRNFDKTITTIPTYALVTDAFINWRGMQTESEGRRIKRAIYVDANTIGYCSRELLATLWEIDVLRDYLDEKDKALRSWNASRSNGDGDCDNLNCRRLTTIGTYRAYCEAYLRNHPMVHQGMTVMVRQRPATEHGLPLEVYCFSREKNWVAYEGIVSDIFDHLLAAAPEFDLRVYQSPSGLDVRQLADQLQSRGRPALRGGAALAE